MSDVQNQHRHIPEIGDTIKPWEFWEEGERANGKDLGKEKKWIQGKRDKKRAYGVGRTLLSMLGKEDSVERVLAVGHDCLWMF